MTLEEEMEILKYNTEQCILFHKESIEECVHCSNKGCDLCCALSDSYESK